MTSAFSKLEVSGNHFEIGKAIGGHFSSQIHEAFDAYSFLQNDILPYHATLPGKARYDALLDRHRAYFPEYILELEGIAEGANRPFRDVFLVNLRGEYAGYIHENEIRGCSDCSLLTDDVALMGHNEDGAPAFASHMYFVTIHQDDGPSFTACSYPGFLCGNAFGFNLHGICCSIDNILPQNIQVGLGRHFLARSLLDAESIDDAITRITPGNRASGFSYTIGSTTERRIVQVEVTPTSYYVHEISGPNFHANHILKLEGATQTIKPSSISRVKRADELINQAVPQNMMDILKILGDESHPSYPIYRTATAPDDLETFCTALFDLDERQLRVYPQNPVGNNREFVTFQIGAADN